MSNNKDSEIIIKPVSIAVLSVILTLINSFFSKFGTVFLPNNFGRGEMIGVFISLTFLLLPVFIKKYRKYIWTKNGLITLFVALAINLPIGIYCAINRYNLFGVIL